jgi:hypothetical protein
VIITAAETVARPCIGEPSTVSKTMRVYARAHVRVRYIFHVASLCSLVMHNGLVQRDSIALPYRAHAPRRGGKEMASHPLAIGLYRFFL